MNVQAWIEDDDRAEATRDRISVNCLACRQIHLLDPSADRVRPPEQP